MNRTQFFPYRRWDRGWNDPQDFDKAEHGRSMLYGASAGDGDENDDQCRQLLDRAGQASWRAATTAAQMEALMERYGRV